MTKISRLCWVESGDTWKLLRISRRKHIKIFFESPQAKELLEDVELDIQRETEIPKYNASELAQRIIEIAQKVTTAKELFMFMNERYGTEKITPILINAMHQYEDIRKKATKLGFVPTIIEPKDAVHPETYTENGVNLSISLQMAARFIVNHIWKDFGMS